MQSLRHHIIAYFCLGLAFQMLTGCAPSGIYHTVQPGQTLYRIALSYKIPEAELARVNGIKDPRQIKAGERIYIPGASQAIRVPATVKNSPTTTATRSTNKTTKTTTAKVTKPTTAKPVVAKPTATKTATRTTTKTPKASKGIFVWPVKGEVIGGFGSSSGAAQKGIEIAAPKGSTVTAAAPGKVIYSGSAIRGYGNLIILEHSDSYFTVYGYNQKNLVRMDDFVGQGDKIALSGSPSNGKSPRLHFEIRHGKAALNPIFYLP